jgi:hypothetical protein
MANAEQGGVTITLTGPTIYAGALAVAIAAAASFLFSQIPDTQVLGWPTAKVKQGLDSVTWAAVLPMFFYFRTGLAQARLIKRASAVPAESSAFRFWRYAFVTAFALMAAIEILNVLLDVFVNALLGGLAGAGLLGKDIPNAAEDIQKFVAIQIQSQAVVILPVMALCSLAVGWIAESFALPRRILYLLATALVFIGFRVLEFTIGLSVGLPAMKFLADSGAAVVGYFLLFPLGMFLLSLIGFLARATVHKIAALLIGGGRAPVAA